VIENAAVAIFSNVGGREHEAIREQYAAPFGAQRA
jgi:hypothetical protein